MDQGAVHSINDNAELARCLSSLVSILMEITKAHVSGVVLFDEDDALIVSEGFSKAEKQQLFGLTKPPTETLESRLKAWWPGSLTCYPLNDVYVGMIFAGRRDKRGFSSKQQALFDVLNEFVTVAAENVVRPQVESKLLAEERDRIACELHDGLSQSIYSMALQIKVCRRLIQTDLGEADAKLAKLEQLAATQIEDIREYMRALKDNRGISTDLPAIIKKHMRQFCALHGLKFDFVVSGKETPLSREINDNVYYVICEALANIARHAGASKAHVSIVYEEDELALGIEDDGSGFDLSSLNEYNRGMGLENIENRIHQIGGTITIQSRPSEGTRIIAIVPYEHTSVRSSAF
jgi:signal transduction histidine kinase